MNDIQGDVRALAAEVADLKRQLVARNTEVNAGSNRLNLYLSGQGALWGGLAVGVALGAAIVCAMWVAATVIRQDSVVQQGEAYKRAVYMLAPRFAEEIDKELDRQKARENEFTDPDHHAAPSSDAKPEPAPSEPTADAASAKREVK